MERRGERCQTRLMSSPSELKEQTRVERIALIELLEQLGPEEWRTPSLCDGWTVRDVAAHLAYAPVATPVASVIDMTRARFSINKMIHDTAVRESRRNTGEILDQLRENVETDAKPMGMPLEAAVSDSVVHQLDIRRPLGEPRPVPSDAFRSAADFFAHTGFPASVVVGGNVKKRIAGLRLVADDADWSHGEGPEVHASSEALMLMLAGRPVGADEFTGPGAAELFSRLLRRA